MSQAARRDGFAIVIVMVLMAVGTALVFAAMTESLAEADTAAAASLRRRALVAAESEAWRTLRDLSVPLLRSSPAGHVSSATRTVGELTLIATVDKVDNSNVWIVATATIQRSAIVARHRVGLSALIPGDTTDLNLHPVPQRAWAELF